MKQPRNATQSHHGWGFAKSHPQADPQPEESVEQKPKIKGCHPEIDGEVMRKPRQRAESQGEERGVLELVEKNRGLEIGRNPRKKPFPGDAISRHHDIDLRF